MSDSSGASEGHRGPVRLSIVINKHPGKAYVLTYELAREDDAGGYTLEEGMLIAFEREDIFRKLYDVLAVPGVWSQEFPNVDMPEPEYLDDLHGFEAIRMYYEDANVFDYEVKIHFV